MDTSRSFLPVVYLRWKCSQKLLILQQTYLTAAVRFIVLLCACREPNRRCDIHNVHVVASSYRIIHLYLWATANYIQALDICSIYTAYVFTSTKICVNLLVGLWGSLYEVIQRIVDTSYVHIRVTGWVADIRIRRLYRLYIHIAGIQCSWYIYIKRVSYRILCVIRPYGLHASVIKSIVVCQPVKWKSAGEVDNRGRTYTQLYEAKRMLRIECHPQVAFILYCSKYSVSCHQCRRTLSLSGCKYAQHRLLVNLLQHKLYRLYEVVSERNLCCERICISASAVFCSYKSHTSPAYGLVNSLSPEPPVLPPLLPPEVPVKDYESDLVGYSPKLDV